MHYYQFNIGDYSARTAHLSPIEDLAYRRMIDLYVKNESPLPKKVEEIARLTRLRGHEESIKIVLSDFFKLTKSGWVDDSIQEIVDKYKEKSEKAKKSAKARWEKESSNSGKKGDANALRTQTEGNANHKPLTNNHKPLTNNQETAANDITLPDWIDSSLWSEYMQTRKKLKCVNSPIALNTIINKLIKYESEKKGDGNLALELANSNAWKNPYKPKPEKEEIEKPREIKSAFADW